MKQLDKKKNKAKTTPENIMREGMGNDDQFKSPKVRKEMKGKIQAERMKDEE